MPSDKARARSGGQNLAELLAREGPLSLDSTLRYATGIAAALREMHQDGRSHGSVDPEHIFIKASAATLLPSDRRGYPDPLADLSGFGSVLYAMLTGKKPSRNELRLAPPKPAALKGPSAVRAAATRLAERCLAGGRDTAPDLQKILTEVRLLHIMAKQLGADSSPMHLSPVPVEPPLPRPQPLAVYAGKATPIINPPVVAMPKLATVEPPPDTPVETPAAPAPEASERIEPWRGPFKPAENSPQTKRARGSHSRPVLQDVMCPKCKGYHVRLSRPRTGFERFLNLLGMGVHRCHRCFYRYIPLFGRKIVRKST